jgi:hypothetical protein
VAQSSAIRRILLDRIRSRVRNESTDCGSISRERNPRQGLYQQDIYSQSYGASGSRRVKSAFDAAIRADILLGERWAIVRNWSEQARYEVWTASDASAMIDAVAGGRDKAASEVVIELPYRSAFSLLDISVNARQIERARAIGADLRGPEDLGRRFDTTFTGGQYFEGVIMVYIMVYMAPELTKQHSAA